MAGEKLGALQDKLRITAGDQNAWGMRMAILEIGEELGEKSTFVADVWPKAKITDGQPVDFGFFENLDVKNFG